MLSAASALLAPASALAQAPGPFDRPAVWVGGSWTEVAGARGVEPAVGLAARAGVQLDVVSLGIVADYWPDYAGFALVAAQVELVFTPLGRRAVSPLLLVGAGRVWGSHRDSDLPIEGGSSTIGVGVRAPVRGDLAVQAELVARSDDGGFNGQARAFAGWVPGGSRSRSPASSFEAGIVMMNARGGPWEVRNPAYSFRFASAVDERVSVGSGLTLVHWRIPTAENPRGYVYDTRAVVLEPEVVWRPRSFSGLSARAGPAVAQMGEGPDRGTTFGAHARVGASAGWRVPVAVSVGWLWLSRDSEAAARSGDQHVLSLSLGLSF